MEVGYDFALLFYFFIFNFVFTDLRT